MHILKSVTLLDGGKALSLDWENGTSHRFHAIWMRANAQDPDVCSDKNGQRLETINDVSMDVSIADAQIKAGALTVRFATEGRTSVFSANWLAQHAYDCAPAQPAGWVPQTVSTWDGSSHTGSSVENYNELSTSAASLHQWLSQVERIGFARMTGGPVESQALLKVARLFGHVRETNYGQWFEVRTQVNAENLAYTGMGLQAHTDNPYRDPVPTLQILYCLENSAVGGESLVVDGFRAAQLLRERNEQHFDLLTRYCARFDYQGGDGVHLHARRPMIELSPDGELIAIRFNNRSIAPVTDVPYGQVEDYYRAYRHLAQIIDDPVLAMEFKLAPGECFIVDNTRVLHGRRGYGDAGGSRWLQGCYPDKDGLLSTLRVLEHRQAEVACA